MQALLIILKYIFIGAVQGITETLPVSSSGHLVIVHQLLGLKDDSLSLSILLHFASFIAIFMFFRKTIIELIKNFFLYIFKKDKTPYKQDFKYGWLVIIASIPAGIIGYKFNDVVESNLSNLLTVGISLLVTAFILYAITKVPRGEKGKENITFKDAIFIGLIQAVAIIPGISRSGSTISASLSRKMDIDNSIKFSFLLFLPVALGAALLDVKKFINDPVQSSLMIPYILAFLTAILFTYLSLFFFIGIIKKGKLSYFSIYCSIVGVLAIGASFFI